jgi:hypothetical protein
MRILSIRNNVLDEATTLSVEIMFLTLHLRRSFHHSSHRECSGSQFWPPLRQTGVELSELLQANIKFAFYYKQAHQNG